MIGRIGNLFTRIRALPPLVLLRRQPKLTLYRPRTIDHPEHMYFGRGTTIREYSWLSTIPQYMGKTYSPRLEIGDEVYIGRYACITCLDHVAIGDGCVLSEHVYVADSEHGNDPGGGPIMQQHLVSRGPVSIGRRCFIGYGARILPGVTLGEFSVVGANAVVTRSFEPYSMVVGSPARLIKRYNRETGRWEDVK
ncbi:MAG: acyltransferase [Sphingomonas sp.]